MKKLLIGLLTIICLGTFMVGCGEKDKNKASEKVLNEFAKVIETKNALNSKEFILHNIKNVTEETADKMITEYEVLLNNNFSKLGSKYNSGTYFNVINETVNEQRVLNLENIKDEKIKEEVMSIVSSGYTFKIREGCYYLTTDYTMIADAFGQYLSENLKPYYELRKKDLEHPTFIGDYIGVGFEEVKNRVVTLERAIRDNKGFANREDIKELMKCHVQALLTVNHFNKAVNYETGELKKSVKNVYEELKGSDLKISKYAAEEMDKLLTEYKYVLKQDNEEAYKKVNSLKFKIVDEVGGKIEEYYLVR